MRRLGAIGSLAMGLVALAACARADEAWTTLCDFDDVVRPWSAESGPTRSVTGDAAHGGRHSLAVILGPSDGGRMLRQTWQVDVNDLKWSLDSRIRFWIRGSRLARQPHGGILLIESGGRVGGGDSHWFLEVPGDVYSDESWRPFTSGTLRSATNPGWAPDADGKPDPARIARVVFVAQQDALGVAHRPCRVYLDDVQVSRVEPQPPPRWRDAEVESKPDRVTPIWRGFQGRKREHPALVTFADVRGWRVAQFGQAEARMVRSEEEPCYEDVRHQAKLIYRAEDGAGRFDLTPPQPIAAPGPFNAVGLWVYGNNWDWMPDPQTPQVSLWARFVDAGGQRHRLNLGRVNFKFYGWLTKRLHDDPLGDSRHSFWGGVADGRIRFPAKLEAIEVHGGVNRQPRTIYLESLCVYQDDMPLPRLRPELIENLPFPTTPDTILPTIASPAAVALARQGDAYVFTARGDETIQWRYTPRTGALSDLTVAVAGRPPITPCAGAGPVFAAVETDLPGGDAAVRVELQSVRMVGVAVETQWHSRCPGRCDAYSLRLEARGKSMLVDWRAPGSNATALRLGGVRQAAGAKLIRVPYMNISRDGPSVLLAGETFVSTLLDWYRTESSEFYSATGIEGTVATINGGASYHPLTDGTRNPLGERQFINVSSRFEEVLPNIPNAPSTQAAVLRENLYCHIGDIAPNRFDRALAMWQTYHRKGIRRVRVSHHEDSWTNGADVGQGGQEYTMCIEAAPEVGDAKLIAYCRAMRRMGYFIGLYENFTDYNPLGRSWDEHNALRDSTGELVRVWPPTYAIRPLKAVEMAYDYPRRVREKFGTNTAYRDCHTAYPPWGQVDYQAGVWGAGKFAANFRAWGALLRDGSRAYGGPIFSEGGYHWFFAGLVDGNYGQIGMPDPLNYPLLLDFDLQKLHPLEADISVTPGWGWGPSGTWQGLAATIAYGHIGFLPFANSSPVGFLPLAGLEESARYYYLMQQLQSRYVMTPVAEIRYHRRGKFYNTTEALKADAHLANQVFVRYANGLTVAVNYNAKERWQVELGGRRYDLSPYGWAAAGKDFVEYCTEIDGRRIGFVDSPAYRFADGGGKLHDFGPVATEGIVALIKDEPAGARLVLVGKVQSVRLELPGDVRLEAFDAADKALPAVAMQREGATVRFTPTPQTDYYRLIFDRR